MSPAPFPRYAARLPACARPAEASRWCRPWARCTPAISRWCARPRSGRAAWWCRSSSIRPSSRRTRISPAIRAALPPTLKCSLTAKVDLVWAPSPAVMYPDGFATQIAPAGAAQAGLEDKFRPHFFGGVATVVAKLFTQVGPDVALFGEKDYQQLRVVTQMARDLDLPVKVVGACRPCASGTAWRCPRATPICRPDERANAPALYRVLKQSAARIKRGEPPASVLSEGAAEIMRAGFTLDYLEARHARTLAPVSSRQDGPIRLLVAARIGKTRLIDNIAV